MASSHGQITATGHEGHEHHVLPMFVYMGVYGSLLVLTVLVSFWDLGPLSLPVAMVVAVIKAAFVIGFFMHLRYDSRFLSLIVAVSILFLAIFFSFTLFDLTARGEFSQEEKTFLAKEQGAAVYRVSMAKLTGHHHHAPSAIAALEARRKAAIAAAKAAAAAKSGKGKTDKPKPAVEKYTPPSDEYLAKAKELFVAQCASCHGKEGRGDGLAAQGFPKAHKPRNYYTDKFKNGHTVAAIYKSITKGFPPYMNSFQGLPSEQRLMLARYVRHIYMVNQVLPKQKDAQKRAAPPRRPATRKAAPTRPAPRRAAPTKDDKRPTPPRPRQR